MRQKSILFVLIASVFILASCTAVPSASPTAVPTSAAPTATPAVFAVTSPGIVNGTIDPDYGVNGKGISIPIDIQNAPAGTVCFALVMHDPDAVAVVGKDYLHWLMTDFTLTSLPAGFNSQADGQAVLGKNDAGTFGYYRPAPPDKDHTYVITVYALDAKTGLSKGFTKAQFDAAIQGHVLAQAEVKGIYKK